MTILGLALLLLTVFALGAKSETSPRQRLSLDSGWKFRRDPDEDRTNRPQWLWRPAEGVSLDLDTLPPNLEQGEWKPIRAQDRIPSEHKFAWLKADLSALGNGESMLLTYGATEDHCLIFVNGRKIDRFEGWREQIRTPLAELWTIGGPNEMVLLLENRQYSGGLASTIRIEAPESGEEPIEANPHFDDGSWGTVDVPHDYVVEGVFDPDEDTGHGSLPRPTAWYRKTFLLPAEDKGKVVYLDFDGIFRNATIWLNGEKLGNHPSGYIGVRFDVTAHLRFGEPNVLAVHVDPRQSEGWWYEGGGIYRHVWLTVVDPIHIKPDGLRVRANPGEPPYGSHSIADIEVNVKLRNAADTAESVEVDLEILDPHGKVVQSVDGSPTVIPPQDDYGFTFSLSMKSKSVDLWTLENPALYTVRATVRRSGEAIDQVEESFGFRTIRFDKDQGFFLNGKPVKLKGTCNHQDHAGVGIAMPDSLMEWRIRKLKEMGSNAYRCAHNPPATELLDACDRLGMLVVDETRHLGNTTLMKSPSGTPATDLSELEAMILRDRNHPSIILWSLFNEEPLQGTEEGLKIFEAMKDVCSRLDGTRPTTGAVNFGFGEGVVHATDVYGFNYSIGQYEPIRKAFWNLPLYGSETGSTVSTRGIYANDATKGYVSAYDRNHPAWAETAENAWRPIAERPWMAGAFVWTGFDYKGEPTPYGWPCINSHFGIMDICGFPKDNWWYYKAWWGDEPLVHILPHWTWPGQEGREIEVWCHSNADEVELFLNGASLGRKAMPRFGHLEWQVRYAPGRLEAKAFTGGNQVAEDSVETAGAPASIRVSLDDGLRFAPGTAYPIKVEILDAQGRVVPTADNLVSFEVNGEGEILGVGNGDPSSQEPDKASARRAFNGLCMVLLQAGKRPGTMTLAAKSPGLKGASATFEVKPR